MVDRGFQIGEDLLHCHCTLFVPPRARIKAQMIVEECNNKVHYKFKNSCGSCNLSHKNIWTIVE